MKRVKFSVPVLLALLVLVIGCGPSETGDSGKTVERFYDHLNEGDGNAAMALYTNEVRERLQGEDGQPDESFVTWIAEETRGSTLQKVKIVKEDVDDDAGTATVVFELFYAGGDSERRTVSMIREDGDWKLGFIDRA